MVTVFNNYLGHPMENIISKKIKKNGEFHSKNAVSMATDSQNATFYYLIKSIVSHLTVIHHQLVILYFQIF